MSRLAPSRLFEEFILAQISFLEEADTDGVGNHYIVHRQARFPEQPKSEDHDPDQTLGGLLKFCVPIANPWSSEGITDDKIVHDVVFTNEKGDKMFGTCLCLKGAIIADSLLAEQLGGDPQSVLDYSSSVAVFCLLSSMPLFKVARSCLIEFCHVLQSTESLGEPEKFIWWLMHHVVVPPKGPLGSYFRLPRSNTVIEFEPHLAGLSSEISLLPLFRCLSVGNITSIISQLLLEQPVLFFSDSYPLLTTITEGIISLLYPFEWKSVYVPMIPGFLTELLEAPGLYIYGALTKDVEMRLPDIPEETLKVDLDRDCIFGGSNIRHSLPGLRAFVRSFQQVLVPGLAPVRSGSLKTLQHQNDRKDLKDSPPAQGPSREVLAVINEAHVDDEMEKKFNEEIQMAFILYYTNVILGDFFEHFTLGEENDFDAEAFLRRFPRNHHEFMQAFVTTNLFNELIDKYRPTNTFEDGDFFASLVFPKQAQPKQTYSIDFGDAGVYEQEPMVNTESLKPVGDHFLKMTFRLDYFDQLRKSPKSPYMPLIKKLDSELQAIADPQPQRNCRWMHATTLLLASKVDQALEDFSALVDHTPAIKSLKKFWAKIKKAERKAYLKSPSVTPQLKAALKEHDGRQMTRRSSQFNHEDDEEEREEREENVDSLESISSKDDDWVEDDQWGTRGYFRPTDRIILNETDPNLPPLPMITDPLKLANEALELIISLYKVFSDIEEESFVFNDQTKFLEIVHLSAFKRFTSLTTQFQYVQIGKLSLDDRLCFFLNVRTCLALHSFAEFGVPHSLFKRLSNLHQKIVYNIGGNLFAFSDITFGVLKGSMSLPDIFGLSFIFPVSKFDLTDPRYPYRNTEKIPLLNLVIFEGTASQPLVIIHRPSNFRAQLKAEAERYCNDHITIKKKTIYIPRNLLWYVSDFGKSDKDVVMFLFENLPDSELAKFLTSLGQKPKCPLVKGVYVRASEYAWDFQVRIRNENSTPDL